MKRSGFCVLLLVALASVASMMSAQSPAGRRVSVASTTSPDLRKVLLRVPRHHQAGGRPQHREARRRSRPSARDWQQWEKVAEMLETGHDAAARGDRAARPTPSARQPRAWVRASLKAYETAHAGDPGRVTVRRLTSGEYAYAIRDLTGIDIKVGIDASSDSVGGEGFTNFGDVQFVQDASIERYLEAAKLVADHAVIGAGPLEFYPDAGQDRPRALGAEPHQRALRREGLPRRLGRRRTAVRARTLRQGLLRRVVLQASRRARRSRGDDSRAGGEGRHHRPLRRAHLDGGQQAEHRLSDARDRGPLDEAARPDRRHQGVAREGPRRLPTTSTSR